jgi:pyrroline-5-carboxylate reductase
MRRASLRPLLLIGAGRMGGALLEGWTRNGLGPVIAVEPKPAARLRKLKDVRFVADINSVKPQKFRAVVLALKPQILKTEAVHLASVASGVPVISIAAGTSIAFLAKALGPKARLLRAMPNTPGAIGCGITAIYASPKATAKDKALAEKLLAALGETVWVKKETLIDAATSVSGSGPAYVFLLVEALAAAGEAEGLPRVAAEKLARATIMGAGRLLEADKRVPAELRRDVTSPGGTTEAALGILLADDGLRTLMKRAVTAARERATQLGS